jgi:type VI secretion system protein ImpB
MATEASVAPKERVNIVYRPATGDAKEDVELPLKLLVMGDFTGKTDDRPVEEREPSGIDKDNFNEVLKAQGISLSLNVENKLSREPGAEMAVKLGFETMADFGPEAVAKKVPELTRLLELREALSALKGPLSNIPEFRKRIQELIKDEAARERLLKELGVKE